MKPANLNRQAIWLSCPGATGSESDLSVKKRGNLTDEVRKLPTAVNSMKIITVSSPQQGVGKSVVSVHLAYFLREIGKSVLVIDLAHTDNTSRTLSEFSCDIRAPDLFEGNIKGFGRVRHAPGITLIRSNLDSNTARWLCGDHDSFLRIAPQRFEENLARLGRAFDYCVVDTAPGMSIRVRSAVVASDYVVMPISPRRASVDGTTTRTRFSDSFSNRPPTKKTGLLLSRHQPGNHEEKRTADDLMAAYPETVLREHIPESADICDALIRRMPVWAYPTRTAQRSAANVRAAMASIVASVN